MKLLAGASGRSGPRVDRALGLHVQQADVVAAQLAAQASAADDVDRLAVGQQADAPREEQIDRLRLPELKELRVLEEERTLLGEEQREARQVDLLLVGFDLGEVGVDRQIERQVGAHAPLDVEADVAVSAGRCRCRSVLSSLTEPAT